MSALAPTALVTIGSVGNCSPFSNPEWLDKLSVDVTEFDTLDSWHRAGLPAGSKQCVFVPIDSTNCGDSAFSLQNLQSSYLGALCARYPEGVFIEHRGPIEMARNSLFASGFAMPWQWCSSETEHPVTMFVYRLKDYKALPTWLNSRFWANPERFDLPPE
jgi:hypothetical protein